MKLRTRIVLTLLAITAALVAPAVYSLLVLQDLREIATELREQETGSTSVLGRMFRTLEGVEAAHDNFVVLSGISRDTAEAWRQDTDRLIARGDSILAALAARADTRDFRDAVQQAERQWQRLQLEIQAERALHDSGAEDPDPDAAFRNAHVLPAFRDMDAALDPIAVAIDRGGSAQLRRAREVADQAQTTTLVALAFALLLTLAIGWWLARGLLRPIEELRQGMHHVADGDFEPDVRVPVRRPDEIGDLARSFSTMTEQLAELDRLKAEFVSVASHEIKTPLSVIRGYVSLLADGIYGHVNEQQKKTLSAVSDQTDRLTRLVHRLLDISRFEAGGGRLELRRINLRDFLDELTSGFRVLAFQNGIDFHVGIADDLPTNLVGDPDRLNEVLGNLLSNAFKFTPRGGTIRLDASRDGTGVVVEVEDTGVGIPPDKLPRIFEKFYQVENEAQPRSIGSGLGLAIAYEIVQAHGGTITADSEVGKGTRFQVTLPERPPAARGAEPPPPRLIETR